MHQQHFTGQFADNKSESLMTKNKSTLITRLMAYLWQLYMHHIYCDLLLKAKFHYASWFEAGSKLVTDRYEAGQRPASNQL